ncbi:YceI family protein [Thalassomonas sp. M1454]|uniref:YceI family protein n=1 Tax=Thalassomonas sp. M1454 TaxID=2594477 RepID=UPI00117ED4A7|nr:YceI family protein [Thalassomonas sp. M1454]TRX55219.1 YceI family protein [Thalassomonas sp. M1454]
MRTIFILVAMLISFPSLSAWKLDNDNSLVSFISVKKSDIAEVHHFNDISGSIFADGNAKVEINLASVDTGIVIRNERMQSLLFQTDLFPKAEFSVALGSTYVDELKVGVSKEMMLMGQLSLHGETKSMQIPTYVTKVNDKKLLIVSIKPAIVNANDFSLTEGITKLQEIAKLPSISKAVPVSFVLTFTR